MAHISSQTLLSTVRTKIDVGARRSIKEMLASNYTGGAVIAKVYLVPVNNASGTITNHLVWIISVPANTTSKIELTGYSIELGEEKFQLEAEAASNTSIVLTVLGN